MAPPGRVERAGQIDAYTPYDTRSYHFAHARFRFRFRSAYHAIVLLFLLFLFFLLFLLCVVSQRSSAACSGQ